MVTLKRNSKLYIVQFTNGVATSRHRIDIYSDLDISQTVEEKSYRQRTLHRRSNLYEAGMTRNANPANFSFTSLVMDTGVYPLLFTLATNVNNAYNIDYFDIYIDNDTHIWKVEKSVIESLVFNISPTSPLSFTISGTASKLYRVSSMPLGLTDLVYAPTRYYGAQVSLGGTNITYLTNINIEFVNEINWNQFGTIHNSGDINYPTTYTLGGKRVSGSVGQMLTDSNDDLFDIVGNTDPLVIDIISEAGQTPSILKFNLPSVVYTSRIDYSGDIITRVFDYRLNSNSVNVKPIYKGV